jgi:hypothetical protein
MAALTDRASAAEPFRICRCLRGPTRWRVRYWRDRKWGGDLNAAASPPAATLPALQTAPAVAPAATPMVSASVTLAASVGEVALAIDASAVDIALSDLTEETLL